MRSQLVTISREEGKNKEYTSLLDLLEYGKDGLGTRLGQSEARRTEAMARYCRVCDAVREAGPTLHGCSAKLKRQLNDEIEYRLKLEALPQKMEQPLP